MSRSPDKNECLRTLVERRVPIGSILDVGVMTGTPELARAFPTTKHFLFEPVVEFNVHIEAMYKDVPHELINCAVSNETGQVHIGLQSIISGVSISHSAIVDQPGYSGLLERLVPMTTIDDWVERSRPEGPYLLKVDIDGFELRVIEGARKSLANTIVVVIETPIDSLSERIRALELHGFELLDLAEPVYYDDALWQCDAVMIAKEVKSRYFKDLNAGFDAEKWSVWRAS